MMKPMHGRELQRDHARLLITARFAGLMPSTRLRLEHDLHVLKDLNEPTISTLVSHDLRQDQLVVTVSSPDGQLMASFDRVLRPLELLTLARNVLRALARLHDCGLLHRDVRPANVVVPKGDSERACLLCFGASLHDRGGRPTVDDWRETLPYTSPEQVGLIRGDVGPRSDLYSVGAMMYAALAGRPPHQAESMRDLFAKMVSATAPSLPDTVPPPLVAVITHLLRFDPRDRYQTAQGALADLEILERCALRVEGDFIAGQHDRRDVLAEPIFVGREIELSQLVEHARACFARRQNAVLVVEAPSGGGKSRLLEAFALQLRREPVALVQARGRRSETREPLQMLRAVLRQAVDEIDAVDMGVLEAEHGPALRALLDDSRGVPGGEAAVVAAVHATLDALASHRSTLVVLDDCQWADAPTLRFVQEQTRRQSRVGLCVVASYRSDEVEVDGVLSAMRPALRLSLPPLDTFETKALLTSMAGALPDAVCEIVGRLATTPFVAVELLRGLVESGGMIRGDNAWTLRPGQGPEWSLQAASASLDRIRRLEPQAVDVLRACATLGRTVEFDAICGIVEERQGSVLKALDRARAHALLWRDADGGRYTFLHDRIRESLLDQIPPEERRALNLRAARFFARTSPHASYRTSFHYAQAGAYVEAFPHALRAADSARRGCALDVAEEHYRIAMEAMADQPQEVQRQVVAGLAQVLMWRARHDESESLWLQALRLDPPDLERARILGSLGQVHFKTGRAESACAFLRDGLRILGYPCPRSRFTLGWKLLWEALIQVRHSLAPARFLACRPLQSAAVDCLAYELFDTLGHVSVEAGDVLTVLWALIAPMNALERYPPTPALGMAWVHHGNIMAHLPWFSRARAYTSRGLEVLEKGRDAVLLSRALAREAFLELSMGNLRRAAEVSVRCQRLGEQSSDHWEVHLNRLFYSRALFLLGHARQAAVMARDVWRALTRSGHTTAAYAALSDWVRNTGGQVPAAEIPPIDRGGDPLTRCEIQQIHAFYLLARGQPAAAGEHFDRSAKISAGAEPIVQYPARFCWAATAWRLAVGQCPAGNGALRARYLARAKSAARKAMWQARRSPMHLPHAYRETAILAAESGDIRRARRLFVDALRIAVQQESMYNFAWTLFERGRIGRALGWTDAEDNIADARWAFHRLGMDPTPLESYGIPTLLDEDIRPPSASLADRFQAAIEGGRRIVTSLDRDQIFKATREAAVALLRAPHVDIRFEARQSDSSRSFISLPVRVQGQVVAWLEAAHDIRDDFFHEEERLLAEWLAGLAGAALENAGRFEAMRVLSSALEARRRDFSEALEEKETMLHEIHHRVKNSLQVISSLLNMQSSYAGSAEIASNFVDMSNKIRTIAAVHEFVYSEDNLAEISMQGYLTALVQHGAGWEDSSAARNVACRLEAVHLDLSRAVHCGLLVTELLPRAVRGASAGHAVVSFGRRPDGRIALAVRSDSVQAPSMGADGWGMVNVLGRAVGTVFVHSLSPFHVEVVLHA